MLPFPTAANATQLQANIAFVNSHTSQAWTFNLQANTTFNLTAQQELTAGANVKIVGMGNSVITPVPGIRAFKVNAGATAEFVNLAISGAKITATRETNPGGAAIWVAGIYFRPPKPPPASVTLNGVSVTNNTVFTDGIWSPAGGGIFVDMHSNLTVVNSHIDDNQVLGVKTDGTQGIAASASGGGLAGGLDAGIITISESTISNNKAVGSNSRFGNADGGGIMWGGAGMLLNNVTFNGNIAQGGSGNTVPVGYASGGAISIAFGNFGQVKLVGLTVTNNKAIGGNNSTGAGGLAFGGGIAWSSGNNATLTVLNSSFLSNTAQGGNGATNGGNAFGGAILQDQTALNLLNSTLGQNTAQGGNGTTGTQGSGFGGGLSAGDTTEEGTDVGTIPQLFNNTIVFNQALNGTGTPAPGGGGGIWTPVSGATNIASALNNLVQGNKTNGVGADVNAAGVPITVLPGGGPNIIGGSILQIAPTLRTILSSPLPFYPLLPNATLAIKTGTISVVAAIAAAEGTNMSRVTDEVGNFRTTGFQIDLGAVQFIKGLVTVTIAPVATITESSLPQSVAVSATVTSPDGIVNEGIVTFILFDIWYFPVGPTVQANVRGGVTTPVSLTVPGNTPEGTYTIQAFYNDPAHNFADALSTTTLTIDPWT
jgi:hypothetical protein